MMHSRLTWLVMAMGALAAGACRAEGDVASFYEVVTAGTSTKLKLGEQGKVMISIKAKNGAHVSDEAPLRIELSSGQGKLAQEKLTLADSLNPKKAGQTDFPDPRFEVPFTPTRQGSTTVEAKMIFFICTEKQCSRQTKNLSLAMEVL